MLKIIFTLKRPLIFYLLILLPLLCIGQVDHPSVSIFQKKLAKKLPYSFEVTSHSNLNNKVISLETKVYINHSSNNGSYYDFIAFCSDSLIYTHTKGVCKIIDLKDKEVNIYDENYLNKYLRAGLTKRIFRPLIINNYLEAEIDMICENREEVIGDTIVLHHKRTSKNIFGKDVVFSSASYLNRKDSLIYRYFSKNDAFAKNEEGEENHIYLSNYNFFQTNFDSLLNEADQLSKRFKKITNTRTVNSEAIVKEIEKQFTDTFLVRTIDDEVMKLIDFSDKRFLLLEFWFPACSWCKPMADIFQKIYIEKNYGNVDFIGIEITNRSTEILKNYANINRLSFPLVSVINKEEISFLDNYGSPTILLYDKFDKKVLHYFSGYSYKRVDEIKEWLRKLE